MALVIVIIGDFDTLHNHRDDVNAVLHRFDVLDAVWFITYQHRRDRALSVPVHCKQARCFEIERNDDVGSFVSGMLAMHRAIKQTGVAAMFQGALGYVDLSNVTVYSFGAKIRGVIELKHDPFDLDPLEVSDFSASETSDSCSEPE
jgi:hypothetical protein